MGEIKTIGEVLLFNPNENNKLITGEVLEEMEEDYAEEAPHSNKEEYLVRGALLGCRCGSHPRRLNLPVSYGCYILDGPVMCVLDCEVGDDKNITAFGICQASTPPSSENIFLKPFINNEGMFHNFVEMEENLIQGPICMPRILGGWLNGYEKTQLSASIGSDPINLKMDVPALTTNSFLVCASGGIIEPITSGQEFIQSAEDMNDSNKNKVDYMNQITLERYRNWERNKKGK